MMCWRSVQGAVLLEAGNVTGGLNSEVEAQEEA
jgi:hypothetical protein